MSQPVLRSTSTFVLVGRRHRHVEDDKTWRVVLIIRVFDRSLVIDFFKVAFNAKHWGNF
jgi:hypothetical protein